MRPAAARVVGWLERPGTIVHELAHAIAVLTIPGATLTEVDLTSHVGYEGRVTTLGAIWISFLPLLVNSLLALGLFGMAWELVRVEPTVSRGLLAGVSGVGGLSLAAGAFPSSADTLAPLRIYRQQLPGLGALVMLPVLVVYLPVALVVLPVTHLRRRVPLLGVVSALAYGVVLASVARQLVAGELPVPV